MSQINQYPNEAAIIKSDDFFDLDLETSPGVYQSNKVKWGTIKTQLLIDLPSIQHNLSNQNLVQTDNLRTYDLQGSKSLRWANVENMPHEVSGQGVTGISAAYLQNPAVTPPLQGNGATLTSEIVGGQFIKRSWITTGSRYFRHLPSTSGGSGGCFWFGDHTSVGLYSGFQPNSNYHAVFASQNKSTLFTDVNFASGENPPLDAIAWFRSSSKGVLFPNLTTTQRNAIPTPRFGLVIYNTSTNNLQLYNGVGATGWQNL